MKLQGQPTTPTPQEEMMALFDELSFRKKVRKVIAGLKCPADSGEYKYARLQILRLLSPTSAVVVPLLVLILISILAAFGSPRIEKAPQASVMDPEPVPELDPIIAIAEPMPNVEPDPTLPEIKSPDMPPPGPPVEIVRPDALPISSVLATRSPIVTKRLHTHPRIGGPGTGHGPVGRRTDPGTERAVIRALRWLKKVQESDGSWRLESGGGPGQGSPTAMTALAILTFLSHGEIPDAPEFGDTVRMGLEWLMEHQEVDGRFRGRDRHDYAHPIATYALCEALALTRNPSLREPASRATKVIIDGQHADGGWDYNCRQSARNDTSYSGWCAQAIKAAVVANLELPGLAGSCKRAAQGFKVNAHPSGGFGYTSPGTSHLTGVGVLCLQLLGEGDAAEVGRGLSWLEAATFDWNKPWGKSPIYYWYYTTQAKFHASDDIWKPWDKQMKRALGGSQIVEKNAGLDGKDVGYWKAAAPTEHCKSYVYTTTLNALMLQVYYRYLGTYATPKSEPIEDIIDDERDIELDFVEVKPKRAV